MIGATLCSGIGAPEVAAPAPGIAWRLACEIERFPRAVMAHRHGYTDASKGKQDKTLWGDFTALRVRHMRRLGIPFPNIIVAGTPCQAFSIAGNRRSLSDDRGNLTLEFLRFVHACRRAAGPVLQWIVWENVPGVLSTKDNAFGCFLAGLVGADAPLHSPLEHGRWPGAGMVAGPWARAAWRVLDAQYFGVAQRRERVFVVAGFGDGTDPAAILFEPQGVRGNTPPRREAGKDLAPTIASRPTGGGGLGTDFDLDGGLIAPSLNSGMGQRRGSGVHGDPMVVAMALNAHGGSGRIDAESETFVTHALRADGFDASEDGTGRGTPLVPVGSFQQNSMGGRGTLGWNGDGEAPLRPIKPQPDHQFIAFSCKDHGADAQTDLSPTLRAGTHDKSHANAGVPPAIAFAQNQLGEVRTSECVGTLNTNSNASGRATAMASVGSAVRRLTPVECERLQAFPDNFTRIPYRQKKDIQSWSADGPRYKSLGNAMNVKVMRWILSRVIESSSPQHGTLSPDPENQSALPINGSAG